MHVYACKCFSLSWAFSRMLMLMSVIRNCFALFQVIITLGILYMKLGISAVIGGLFVVFCAPFMYLFGVCMSKIQKKVLVRHCHSFYMNALSSFSLYGGGILKNVSGRYLFNIFIEYDNGNQFLFL